MIRSFLSLALICLLLAPALQAQKINNEYNLNIRPLSEAPVIDGTMDDVWLEADVATDFHMITPMDTSAAELRTDVRMGYDDENLYIIAVNWLAEPGMDHVVESLRRDFAFGRNDNFIFFLDTWDDQTNGFSFGANAAGAQWDGMMYEGGSVNLEWDTRWVSAVRNYEDRWVFEAAIPFKSIRYDREITEWGINFSRKDHTVPEKSGWAPVPRQLPSAALAYTGNLVWEEPPPSSGLNVSIIPHLVGGVSHNFERSENRRSHRGDAGMTTKLGIGSSMTLDLTVNPDFSQVEVDEQVIDIDRYELFFPEKRQFFLENEDLFANFGNPEIRPFFSRRIGLDAPILFGGRLTGQLNQDWRMGIMNMQTEQIGQDGIPARNHTVFSLKRRVSDRSNIGFFLVNMESMGDLAGEPQSVTSDYNRNVGIEYNLATTDDIWNGSFMLLNSFDSEMAGRTLSHSADLRYADGNWQLRWAHDYVGEDYTAEIGFVPRRGYIRTYPEIGYLFFTRGRRILSHGPLITPSWYLDETLRTTDYRNEFAYRVNFRDGTRLKAWFTDEFAELTEPFDPIAISGEFLEPGSRHNWTSVGGEFSSRPRSRFTYNASAQYGGFYADGNRLYLSGEIGYRFQPFVNLSATVQYNDLDLPAPWGAQTFWLTGTRVDITFTNNLYWTTFTQYNEQLDNINVNSRLQWRFQPASDLFLVYTDNYLPGSFTERNRSVMLKFTYWLTM